MSKKLVKECCMCGKPVFSIKSIYCRACSHFCARMSDERFSPEVCKSLKNYVRKRRGYYCQYTGMELDVFTKSDPYFLEFDHLVPGDPKKIVITSAWINELKGDLTFKEFKGSIVQLYNYWFKGVKIKKKKFRYWFRLNPK